MDRRGSAAGAVALATAAGLLAAAETQDPANVVASGVVGATLILAPGAPRRTCALALIACAATIPGGSGAALAIVVAGHVFWAARRTAPAEAAGWTLVLLGLLEAGAWRAPGAWTFVPQIVTVLAAAAGGRVLAEREAVVAQLEERGRELEEERETHSALSVRYERARIAAELHDIVGHAISVMVVQAAAGQRLAARSPELADETLTVIARAARQAEADIERLVALLGDEEGSTDAPDLELVEELVGRAAGSGLDVTLRLEGDRYGLAAPVAELAYRVVQEGLTNALRHAAGARVTVTMTGGRQALGVTVVNGPAVGDALAADAGGGRGLLGLRERADAVGGHIESGATHDGGWRLHAHLPR